MTSRSGRPVDAAYFSGTPPPPLYDTSSSTTESASWSSRSHHAYFPKSHPRPAATIAASAAAPISQQYHRPTHPNNSSGSNKAMSEAGVNVSKYSSTAIARPSATYRPDYSLSQHPAVGSSNAHRAQSEPGHEQDRFSAYVNRFAAMDPRMDHRRSVERSNLNRRQEVEEYPDPELVLDDTTEQESEQSLQPFESQKLLRAAEKQPVAVSSRTRDLAKRFEMRQQRVAAVHGARGSAAPREAAEVNAPPLENTQTSATTPTLRRRRPLQQPAPSTLTPDTMPGMTDRAKLQQQNEYPMSPASTSKLRATAEIETPSPANVKQIRQMLWDADESLLVSVRPSVHDTRHNDRMNRHWLHYNGPEMAGKNGQRNSRSLSPGSRRQAQQQQYESSADAARNAPTFRSRYYDAAHRSSPDRPTQVSNQQSEQDARERAGSRERASSNERSNTLKHSERSKEQQQMTDSRERAGSRERSTRLERASSRDQLERTNSKEKLVGKKDVSVDPGSATIDSSYSRNATNEDAVAVLLAKLNSISRDDPNAALAQIDAILRAESRSSVGEAPSTSRELDGARDAVPTTADKTAESGATKTAAENDDEDEKDDSSAETSVSSITNPTYQSAKVSSETEQNPVSSNGKPRPSSLKAYTAPYTRLGNDVNRETSPKKKDRPVPITTIKVGSDKKTSGDMDQSPEDEQMENAPNMGGTPHSQGKYTEKGLNWKAVSTRPYSPSFPQSVRNFDNCLNPATDEPRVNNSHSADLAQKIRKWDEMSSHENIFSQDAPVSPSSGDRTDAEQRSIYASRRPHPWDATIPVRMGNISMKETSMESANGVEAQYTPRYAGEQGSSRRRTQQLPSREPQRSFEESWSSPREQTASRGRGFSGDEFRVDPKLLAAEEDDHEDAWKGDRGASWKKTERFTDTFDSAWVTLPASSFFGGDRNARRLGQENDIRQRQAQRTGPIQTYSAQSQEAANRTRQYVPPQSSEILDRIPDLYNPIDDDSEADLDGVEVRLVPSSESKKKGFRGLLKRRGHLSKETAVVQDLDNKSKDDGVKSLRSLEDDDWNPQSRGRVLRSSSKSPSRERSKSLEERRIRNPSIAKKFSRMLRVYDDNRGYLI